MTWFHYLFFVWILLFNEADLFARVFFAEVHYHPRGTAQDEEREEFVELYNDEPLPFDISHYLVRGGISFQFPEGTLIPASGILLLARNPAFIADKHGIKLPAGPFGGRLDNSDDDFELVNTGGLVVSRVSYRDRGRWPVPPDGFGPSLVLRGPLENPRESESWGWSLQIGGTPGEVSFDVAAADIVVNEVYRSEEEDWIEFANATPEDIDVSGVELWLDSGGQRVTPFAKGMTIPAGGHLLWSASEAFRLNGVDQVLALLRPAVKPDEGLAGGMIVLAGWHLGSNPLGQSEGWFPDVSGHWSRFDDPTPGAANQMADPPPIVISELHYHPHSEGRPRSEGEEEEFIELHNAGVEAIDLEGFSFTSGIDYVFPENSVIAAGAYLVVAKNPAHIETAYEVSGVHGPYNGVLSNSGERVRLVDVSGNLVDELRYFDEGSWSRWPDGKGPSLELIDPRQDNSLGGAWAESDMQTESEWQSVEYTATQVAAADSEFHLFLMGAGEALIDDIEVIPALGGANFIPDGTFDSANPLASWRIEGTHIESRIAKGAGPDGSDALHIIASKRGDTRVNRIERQTSPNLRARTDYTVRFKVKWLRGTRLIMTRSWNHGLARVTRISAPALGGTPGKRNSRWQDNQGPLIGKVSQSPALPAPDAAVTVVAQVSDADGLELVELLYRRDRAEFQSVVMKDDGSGVDVRAGDGQFSAQIAGIGARGATAEFFVRARDVTELESSSADHIYQYDDAIAAHEIPAYRVVMRGSDFSRLRSRSPHSNHLLPASLIYRDERIFHGAGVRYRGSPFLRRNSVTGNRKGLRVRLMDDNPLHGDVRIVLDEQEVDSTKQVDRLVRNFLQKARGIPYGERRHVHLILRGTSFGTYEQVLAVDGEYIERAFGPDATSGDLYKIDAHYEITDVGEFAFPAFTSWGFEENKENLRFVYKKRSNEEEDDFSALTELTRFMDTRQTTNDEFDRRIDDVMDVDMWVKGIAVYRAVEDWDTIGGWTGKNVYLYQLPDGRWKFIPWDHDISLGSAALQGDQNPRAYLYTPYYPEVRRLLQRPALNRKFLAELSRLLREDYERAIVDPVLDATWSLLRRTSGAGAPNGLKTFISQRRTFLLTQIPEPSPFAIETNDGMDFSTSESPVILRGTAPYEIEQILVGDESAESRWVDRSTWEIEVPLVPGSNDLDLLAFDGQGSLVDSAQITIDYTGAGASFLRGDANDDTNVDISDAVRILRFLFAGDQVDCQDSADADDSGTVNLSDAIFLLNFLFRGGPELPPPFPASGLDPSLDELPCP